MFTPSLSLTLLALAPTAAAVPSDAVLVTEEAFVSSVDESHAAVRALGSGLAEAEAARRRAGTLGNPAIEYWREQPGDDSSTEWTLAWTPPLDGRFGLGKQAADAGVAAARAALLGDRAELRRELRRVFAEWSVSHERRALLERQLDRVRELAGHERERARTGAESGLSARRLDLARVEVEAALRQAGAALARAEAEIRAWRPDLAPDAAPAPPSLPAPPAAADAEGSPRVQQAEHEHEQAQLEARLSGRFWGFPTLQAGVQSVDEGGVSHSGPILAAAWSIPLFDRDQGERARAERAVAIAEARLARTKAQTSAAIRGELEAYRALLDGVKEAEGSSGEAERVIAAATAAYRAGEAGLTDLLDALRSAFATRLLELDLRAEALAAHRDLEAALGRPLNDGGAR